MRVDAPGLMSAAQRLSSAVAALNPADGLPHPPLAADPASLGAASRLTAAAGELTSALGTHVTALVESVQHLTGAAVTYVAADEQNRAAVAALNPALATGASPGLGAAAPAPPIPADVRAPMPPPTGLMPEAISASTHTGSASAGEGFASGWSQAAAASRNASGQIRWAVTNLPEVLDTPAATPAVTRHLLAFADGLDSYATRADNLVKQATAYAGNQTQARQDIPTPEQFTTAQHKVQMIAQANAASGGKYAAQLAAAVAEKNRLDQAAVSGYAGYHQSTDAATAGDDASGAGGEPGADPGGADPAELDADALTDDAADAADPQAAELLGGPAEEMSSLMPSMLGMVSGLAGGLVGSAARVPQSLMQAGMQAATAAGQGLSNMGQPMDPPDTGAGEPDMGGGVGDLGGADVGATTPAGGEGAPELPVAPSTGPPPAAPITPAGAAGGGATTPAGQGGVGMAPMGMPMGGPGGGGGGKDAGGRRRKVAVRDIPHTEDITGRVDTSRLSVASAAQRDGERQPPDDDGPADDAPGPIVRRLVTRPPKEKP
jgi:hypothetical protein